MASTPPERISAACIGAEHIVISFLLTIGQHGCCCANRNCGMHLMSSEVLAGRCVVDISARVAATNNMLARFLWIFLKLPLDFLDYDLDAVTFTIVVCLIWLYLGVSEKVGKTTNVLKGKLAICCLDFLLISVTWYTQSSVVVNCKHSPAYARYIYQSTKLYV